MILKACIGYHRCINSFEGSFFEVTNGELSNEHAISGPVGMEKACKVCGY